MKIFWLLCCAFALALVSCQSDTMLHETYEFPENHQWLKSEARTFILHVKEAGNYSGFIQGSFVYGSQFAQLPLQVTVSKTAVLNKESVALQIKNEKGEEVGDCTGDVCDVKQLLFSGKHFEPGTYTFTLANQFEFPYFPNIIALGIALEKEK
jgi:hypothetical protein